MAEPAGDRERPHPVQAGWGLGFLGTFPQLSRIHRGFFQGLSCVFPRAVPRLVAMSAQPVHEDDPQDPQAILARLPEQVRTVFLREYQDAVDIAREPAGYHELREVLTEWAILAAAYSQPDFVERFQDVRASVGEYVPMDEVLPPRTA